MFKLVVLSALLAVVASAPTPGGLIAAPVAYTSVVGSVPATVSHHSSSVVHGAAIAAPVVHAAPVAPVVHAAPLAYAAAPAVVAAPAVAPVAYGVHAYGVHGIHAPVVHTVY